MNAQSYSTPKKLGQSAFTLTEVITAVVVVAVLGLTLYLGLAFGFAATRNERENLRATQIMLERMEGIRLLTWDQIQDPTVNPPSFTDYFTSVSTNNSVVYSGTVTVATNISLVPSSTYSPKMLMITVQVRWRTGLISHTRNMSTYVSMNGVQNYIYNN